ncbi:nicotinamide riboside kinase 1 isoform X2 [Conger conger]|nr:nicotinamide riboside kinase 1 isoform X2 [Conger conger]XP_061116032.1 nicotinamide riboside kinase 1 isoform X2 [Conger conger]
MKRLIIGIGGITNGGKSTLAKSLHEHIPNSCIVAQDAFFKDDSLVAVDSNGFKQYDDLDALRMDRMMSEIRAWQRNPESFFASRGLKPQFHKIPEAQDEVHVLIIEGFLIFNYRPLNELMNKRYFLTIPYDVCKKRRCLRVYTPPDPPGYFDGYVWPMFLKNQKEMEEIVTDLVYLDGMRVREDLFSAVYEEVTLEIQRRLDTNC